MYACSFVPELTARWVIMEYNDQKIIIIITIALNRVGPKIDPCGRPVSVGRSLELNPWMA